MDASFADTNDTVYIGSTNTLTFTRPRFIGTVTVSAAAVKTTIYDPFSTSMITDLSIGGLQIYNNPNGVFTLNPQGTTDYFIVDMATGGLSNRTLKISHPVGNTIAFDAYHYSNFTPASIVFNQNGGNVGVGTTTPWAKLSVAGGMQTPWMLYVWALVALGVLAVSMSVPTVAPQSQSAPLGFPADAPAPHPTNAVAAPT